MPYKIIMHMAACTSSHHVIIFILAICLLWKHHEHNMTTPPLIISIKRDTPSLPHLTHCLAKPEVKGDREDNSKKHKAEREREREISWELR